MPDCGALRKRLAETLRMVAHPDRLQILLLLSQQERDFRSLINDLDLPGSRVSQHMRLLRAHRIVDDRREGRRLFYRVIQPQLVGWIMQGLEFVETSSSLNEQTPV